MVETVPPKERAWTCACRLLTFFNCNFYFSISVLYPFSNTDVCQRQKHEHPKTVKIPSKEELTILNLLEIKISIKLKELTGTINESSCQVKYKSNTQFPGEEREI